MGRDDVRRVAALLSERNAIDAEIAAITGRPVVTGHLGEWIASEVFDITLEESAVAKGRDGRFSSGPLSGRTVNVKWYGKREGLLDLAEDAEVDHYLVMTGPRMGAASSRGTTRPLRISAVYLFTSTRLLDAVRARGVKIGVATSVISQQWDAAELFPRQSNRDLPLSAGQRQILESFGGCD